MIPTALSREVAGKIATIEPVCLSLRRETSAPPYQSITRFLAGSEWTSLALRGSSTMIRSAPRPVSVPPTEVAYRSPSLEKVQAYRNSTAFKELLPLHDKLAKFRSFVVEGVPL
jgi:hypothetical protein